MPETPASPINAPHTSETPEAASSWFDGDDAVAPPEDVLAEDGSPTAEAEVAAGPLPTEPEDEEAVQAALDDDGEGAEAPAEPPVVEPEPAPGVDQADDGDGGDPPVPPGESAETAKASGTTERHYIVLREYTLDEAMLKSLLEAVKKGEDPHKVLFRFDEQPARNIEHALRLSWEAKGLAAEVERGVVPVLGAVPERNLKVRPVQPKVKQTVSLQFG